MIEILVGDALTRLDEMPDKSVHCAVTSPPYWGLRSYHLTRWIGGDPDCEHLGKPIRGENSDSTWGRPSRSAQKYQPVCRYCGAKEEQVSGGIGIEPDFLTHVDNLMAVFDEVWRVLRDDGTFWLNYGDAYAGSGRGHTNNPGISDSYRRMGNINRGNKGSHDLKPNKDGSLGLKAKNLMLMPSRIAIAMQDRGWILRSEIIWAKTSPMPESVKDRPTNAHEKMFLFAKQPQYYYDHVAVSTPSKALNIPGNRTNGENQDRNDNDMANRIKANGMPLSANLRNVWNLNSSKFAGAHFALFPDKLVEPCVKAGTSEKGVCSECGAPHQRVYKTRNATESELSRKSVTYRKKYPVGKLHDVSDRRQTNVGFETTGWKPTCKCDADIVPATVLDPFCGAGTTALVADRLGRDAVMIEISEEYATMAKRRLIEDDPLRCKVRIET